MVGVVLCGGQSTRMGTDKGFLKYKSKPWAQVAFDKLHELQLPVLISVNKDQQQKYSAIFPLQLLITDDESFQKKGPFAALMSVHVKNPGQDLFILACDMVLMETALLRELLIKYQDGANYDAFVYANDGQPEPLCGIYKAKGLNNILHLYQTNQLPGYSMRFILEQIATVGIPLENEKKKCFQNFNSPSELKEL